MKISTIAVLPTLMIGVSGSGQGRGSPGGRGFGGRGGRGGG